MGGNLNAAHSSIASIFMAKDIPILPKQYGVRIPEEIMALVEEIIEHRKHTQQPCTLSAVVCDAIEAYYDELVDEGILNDK